ncbi:hypothetical protein V499_08887 [Pseudogymnoascus sp. VKM F-103]|nr:hypothetical protein V499_08887 [Pseudogymnoascus sp. VKM F-103]
MAAKAKVGLLTEFPELVPAKIGYYKNTPAGCVLDPNGGNVWNPTIGSGTLRMAMIPKDQPLSHGVMIVMRYWSLMPPDDELYFPPRSLWDYKGFVRSGSIQKKASPGQGIKSKPLRNSLNKNGTTLYDSSGDLMTIDGMTLRGCLGPDQNRKPGSVTEKNF